MNESFIGKAKNLKLLLSDVDGVMTDSKLCWYTDGEGRHIEVKNFESLDGMGMMFLRACGVRTGIVSRGQAPILQDWAGMLGMDILYYSAMNKTAALQDACQRFGVTPQETAFIGDDIIDLGVLHAVGLRLSVTNAVAEVKALADYISPKRGGEGAVRDICEQILKARGQWDDIVRQVKDGAFVEQRRELCIVKGISKK